MRRSEPERVSWSSAFARSRLAREGSYTPRTARSRFLLEPTTRAFSRSPTTDAFPPMDTASSRELDGRTRRFRNHNSSSFSGLSQKRSRGKLSYRVSPPGMLRLRRNRSPIDGCLVNQRPIRSPFQGSVQNFDGYPGRCPALQWDRDLGATFVDIGRYVILARRGAPTSAQGNALGNGTSARPNRLTPGLSEGLWPDADFRGKKGLQQNWRRSIVRIQDFRYYSATSSAMYLEYSASLPLTISHARL